MSNQFYGWRVSPPDFRDLPYSAKSTAKAGMDLRPLMPAIYEQGQANSSVANALAAVIEYVRRKEKSEAEFMPSRLFIYYNARKMEGSVGHDNGCLIRDAMKGLVKFGDCPEIVWPYDEYKVRVKPSTIAYSKAVSYKPCKFYSVRDNNLADYKAAIAAGDAVIFGISVFDSFGTAAVSKNGIVPLPNKAKESRIAGQAVVGVGFDDAEGKIICRNSWGPKWGDKGYFYLPYEYYQNQDLAGDCWTFKFESA